MTVKTKPYHLRLTARFAFYDDVTTHIFWDWPEGAIVDDPDQIKLLEARGAPIERVAIPASAHSTHKQEHK